MLANWSPKADTPSRLDDCFARVAGIPYCACRQEGVTWVAQDAGTTFEVGVEDGRGLMTGLMIFFTGNLKTSTLAIKCKA